MKRQTALRPGWGRYAPLFLLPAAVPFLLCFVWPFVRGLWLSLCSFTTTRNARFVGLSNFAAALADRGFTRSFWLTALLALVSVAVINLLALAAALALTRPVPGRDGMRTVLFLPNLIGGIVLGYIWSVLLDGILVRWSTGLLLDSRWGFWGLVALQCWQQVGYMMIIYIAGLHSVDRRMLEAARMDGAGRWTTLVRVTLPNLMGAVTICLFLTLTNSFKLFDQNLALTAGAPVVLEGDGTGAVSAVRTTELLALNIYNTFYSTSHAARGVAQAKAVLFFVLVAALSALQLRATSRREVSR